MHRKTGPGADGDVAVMHRVIAIVQWLPVQQAVYAIKVKRLPDGNQREQQYKPDRMISKADDGNNAVGVGEPHHGLKRGPDSDTADQGVKDVVFQHLYLHLTLYHKLDNCQDGFSFLNFQLQSGLSNHK